MEKERTTGTIDLDMILVLICDLVGTFTKNPKFDFLKVHDTKIMTELKNYSICIKNKNFSDMDDNEIEEFFEEQSINLFDAISQSNFDFLRNGTKMGAQLLADLVL